MKHCIDPTVDCVFKAILGKEENSISLVHFLNSVLKPKQECRIKEVVILNPFNEKEFLNDKQSILDVKARDEKGDLYQIEIQLEVYPSIKHRILFNWSQLYQSQIHSGEQYSKLKRTISIWVVGKALFPSINEYHLPFSVYNLSHNLLLSDHMQIHIVQLPKWQWKGNILEELDRWMYLFTQGKNVDLEDPPKILQIKEMRPAMETMKRFSEEELERDLYLRRRDYVMQLETIKEEVREAAREEGKEIGREEGREEAKAEMQAVIEEAQKEKERIQQEKERLLNLLKQLGVDPGQGIE